MSIQDEINRIEKNIANTYSALNSMGATMPAEQNSNNLASTARTVPQSGGGGGEAVQEIFYVDGTFDMSTFTFSTSVTYNDIAAANGAGKYIVARAAAIMGTYHVNTIYLSISTVSPLDSVYSGGVATFEGMIQVFGEQIGLPSELLMLAVTVEVDHSGEAHTRIKVVSTQTIK